jgi:inorganic pyrophosphatase
MNLWHDVPLGDDAPEEFNTIVEIPHGSHNKYEIDKVTGLIALDRANYSYAPFPFDYGFAPQTLWDDGDPLDVIILTTFPLLPGILVRVRPVAVMDLTDSGDSDFKIIAVPVEDKRWGHVKDLADINPHSIKEFKHFYETYKQLKGQDIVVTVNSVMGKKEAIEAIKKGVKLYQKKYGSEKK